MSDYSVCIGQREYQVRITNSHLSVDNEKVGLDHLISLDEGKLYLLRDGLTDMALHLHSCDKHLYEALVRGQRTRVKVETSHSRTQSGNKSTKRSAGELRAAMPGLIVEVRVIEGDHVEKGQVVAVMESMKMQMHLRAMVCGVVEAVVVIPGERVGKDDLLLRVAEHL